MTLSMGRSVATLVANPFLGRVVLECGGFLGSNHPLSLDTGTDARSSQLGGARV